MNSDIRYFIDIHNDPGDSWGTCMTHWFGIANALEASGLIVPEEWQYRPGALGPDVESWPNSEYYDDLQSGYHSPEDLIEAGNVLQRWASMLECAGKDY